MNKSELYRKIPKVDDILNHEETIKYLKNNSLNILKLSIDKILNNIRNDIEDLTENNYCDYIIDCEIIVKEIVNDALKYNKMNLKNVINGTGVVIHTNLGRSCINKETAMEVYKIASGYSNLEFDLNSGKRGHRYDHIEKLICQLTGAESAMVVNNNAAAVMLILNTLSQNGEAIVSRGELVEIGGSFRIPDVMKLSNTDLVEVGTTNKTHLKDYRNAITDKTNLLLKVHTSNYRIMGFTESVSRENLVNLGKTNNIPVYEDLGSGLLFDLSDYFKSTEPTVKSVVNSGVDVISFSGDKMLGGPQAGIIIGKKKYVEKMKYNQLTRAFRVDKMTLAALEITFRQYLDIETAKLNIPTIKNLTIDIVDIIHKAEKLLNVLHNIENLHIEIIQDESQVGGGSMPLTRLKTYALQICIDNMKPDDIAKSLRTCSYPVVGRIKNEMFLLDLRTIDENEFNDIKKAFIEIINGGKNV
ncbi:L-seryl-tRNA(Sec) selenium transferase [Clostridiaceae bacterium HSG29]|nr:L-seryl-tRNA(Sec) selenium transferase [Clostridiaceae bacterium HSG29]